MAIVGIAIGVAVTLGFTFLRAGATQMDLLYANLEPSEAGEIVTELQQAGIRYRQEGDGTVIQVQRGKVIEARNLLSQRGLPTSGSIGYEIFDASNTFGQTQFVQDINRVRALQGELERTIRGLDSVTEARVLLSIPERPIFGEEAGAPSASVVVGFSRRPDAVEVEGIQNLVAPVVSGLRPEQVVVTDKRSGRTLAGGEDSGTTAMANERRAEVEAGLERRLQSQLERIVGPGNVDVTVTADINLERVTSQQNAIDPDSQVVIGATSTENASANGQQIGGAASIGEQLPGDTGAAGGEQSNTSGTSETSNFDYTRTTTTRVSEPGEIRRLSVAVAINAPAPAAEGAAAPPPVDVAEIEALVKAAIGFDEARQDTVEVRSIPFNQQPLPEGEETPSGLLSGFGQNDIMRIAELAVLLIVAALTIFFVARPLLKGIAGGSRADDGLVPMPMLAGAGAGGGQVLTGPSGPVSAQLPFEKGSAPAGASTAAAPEGMIDIARIEGQVKASAVKQVSDFADRHPEESVSILRSWLHEG